MTVIQRRQLLTGVCALVVAVAIALADAAPPPRTWEDVNAYDVMSLVALTLAVVCGRRSQSAVRRINRSGMRSTRT